MPSAVIQAMRYEPADRQLMIMFHGVRGAYLYEGVGPAEWSAFRDAESKGTHLNSVFKSKHHPYRHLLPVLAVQNRQGSAATPAATAEGADLAWGEVEALPENPFRLPPPTPEARPLARKVPRAQKAQRESCQFELLPGFRKAA